ncbi:hypothetical protein J6590_088363 [Homalodisca vitripennis]|nr:hypothetical protein J6590_088363 [Homalodisca vitripennis]
MSGRYVVDPWWSSPPRLSSYLKLPATAFLWSKCTSGQCSYLRNNEHAIFGGPPGGTLLPNRHLTSDSLQQLLYGPHLHQVSAASHVTMSGRYVVDPWWSSPPKLSSYLRLPATASLWSTSTPGQCS